VKSKIPKRRALARAAAKREKKKAQSGSNYKQQQESRQNITENGVDDVH